MDKINQTIDKMQKNWSQQVHINSMWLVRQGNNARDSLPCLKHIFAIHIKLFCHSYNMYLSTTHNKVPSTFRFDNATLEELKDQYDLVIACERAWATTAEEHAVFRKIVNLLTYMLINCPCYLCSPVLYSMNIVDCTNNVTDSDYLK